MALADACLISANWPGEAPSLPQHQPAPLLLATNHTLCLKQSVSPACMPAAPWPGSGSMVMTRQYGHDKPASLVQYKRACEESCWLRGIIFGSDVWLGKVHTLRNAGQSRGPRCCNYQTNKSCYQLVHVNYNVCRAAACDFAKIDESMFAAMSAAIFAVWAVQICTAGPAPSAVHATS